MERKEKYYERFGLHSNPFRNNFLFKSNGFLEAVERFEYFLDVGGIFLITGESGCGKSFILKYLVEMEVVKKYQKIYIHFSSLMPFTLLSMIAHHAGIINPGRYKAVVAEQLMQRFGSNSGSTILLIDEAHKLPTESIDDIRLLTNMDYDQKTTFLTVLSGLPQIRSTLRLPQLQSIKRRMKIRYTVCPLAKGETSDYIHERMQRSGADYNIFEQSALDEIYKYSQGLPGIINLLGENALICAASQGKKYVDDKIILNAQYDLEGGEL